jgi:hypothetical protein
MLYLARLAGEVDIRKTVPLTVPARPFEIVKQTPGVECTPRNSTTCGLRITPGNS